MHGIFFYIGLGAGLAVACGLRPFIPTLLAGALGSGGALEVGFGRGDFHFLQSTWWLLAVTVAFLLAYPLQVVFHLAPIPDAATGRSEGARGVDPLAAALA